MVAPFLIPALIGGGMQLGGTLLNMLQGPPTPSAMERRARAGLLADISRLEAAAAGRGPSVAGQMVAAAGRRAAGQALGVATAGGGAGANQVRSVREGLLSGERINAQAMEAGGMARAQEQLGAMQQLASARNSQLAMGQQQSQADAQRRYAIGNAASGMGTQLLGFGLQGMLGGGGGAASAVGGAQAALSSAPAPQMPQIPQTQLQAPQAFAGAQQPMMGQPQQPTAPPLQQPMPPWMVQPFLQPQTVAPQQPFQYQQYRLGGY